jgi:hypothetical protein
LAKRLSPSIGYFGTQTTSSGQKRRKLRSMKRRLSTSPVLVTPREKQPMLLYIAATNQVVERAEDGKEHGVQRPVYYLSEVLSLTK